ncbi:MAG: hypothetical protein ABID79_01545, partial [Elusimicrobiota bacterium]
MQQAVITGRFIGSWQSRSSVIYGKACQVENSIPFVKNQHLLTRFLPAKRVEINEYKFVNDTNNKGV